MQKNILFAGTASLVLLGAFFVFKGVSSSSTDKNSPPPTPPNSQTKATEDGSGNDNRLSSLEEKNRQLQAQLELQEFMLNSQVEDQAEQEEEETQKLVAWPEDLPEKYMPKTFQKNMHEILESCWPDAEWLGMNCQEPPCIAAVRLDSVEGYSKPILNCPQWQQNYGFPDISATEYECPDGSSGYISMLLPKMSRLVDDPFDTTTDPSCMTKEVREDGTVIMHLEYTPECDSRQTPRNARRKNTAYTWGPDGASGFAYGRACGFH